MTNGVGSPAMLSRDDKPDGLTEPGPEMTVCKQWKINLPLPDKKLLALTLAVKIFMGVSSPAGP